MKSDPSLRAAPRGSLTRSRFPAAFWRTCRLSYAAASGATSREKGEEGDERLPPARFSSRWFAVACVAKTGPNLDLGPLGTSVPPSRTLAPFNDERSALTVPAPATSSRSTSDRHAGSS
jgi:hypothetical protein